MLSLMYSRSVREFFPEIKIITALLETTDILIHFFANTIQILKF